MEGFLDVIAKCDLSELRCVGQWYTWKKENRPETRIRERLDRFNCVSIMDTTFSGGLYRTYGAV